VAGLADILRGHRQVGIDTAPFIYHLEGSVRFAAPAAVVLEELAAGTFEGVTSVLTLMEIAVRPLQLGRVDVADEYDILLASYPHLLVVDLNRAVARRAAELRATYRLRPADALQVAACLLSGATALVTNDKQLRRVAEMEVIVLDDYAGP